MEQFLKILEKYGSIKQNGDQYELTLKITPDFLQIPDEYINEFPICRKEWTIRTAVQKNSFEIETADQETNTLSEEEQKETQAFLSKSARYSGFMFDGTRLSKKGSYQDNAFKESLGRIVSIVKGYVRLLGHKILGYMVYYSIDCFCGSRLRYSEFKFRCTNSHCCFDASLKQINDSLDALRYISDLDWSGINRTGENAYYLNRTDSKDSYKVVKITAIERRKWVNRFRKKVDVLDLTRPSLFYPEMEFHPLQRGNEETVPIFLCWIDISGGAKLLRKRDIQSGNSILLILDMSKSTLQAFKPTPLPRDKVLYLKNYNLPIEIPKSVKARVMSRENN